MEILLWVRLSGNYKSTVMKRLANYITEILGALCNNCRYEQESDIFRKSLSENTEFAGSVVFQLLNLLTRVRMISPLLLTPDGDREVSDDVEKWFLELESDEYVVEADTEAT